MPDSKTLELDHELAMLYLSKQDLKNVSPEQLLAMYKDACDRIHEASKTGKKQKIYY